VNCSPKVSVVLANWNTARFLDEAIESVVKQSFEDWVMIAVDTGSTDESPAILERWAAADERIKPVLMPQWLNYPTAVNLGLGKVLGEYVARIESDDLWQPEKLESQIAFLEHPEHQAVGICGTNAYLIDEHGRVLGTKRYPQTHEACLKAIWYRSPLCHSSILVRRAAFELCGRYDDAFLPSEDLDLWFRMARMWQICNLPQPLISYRVWSSTVTSRRLRAALWSSHRIRSRAVRDLGYRRPLLAALYSTATLGCVLLPPQLVRWLFQVLLDRFSRGAAAAQPGCGGTSDYREVDKTQG
jgi:glycosyltransferase involved in cell wall biosynthesis